MAIRNTRINAASRTRWLTLIESELIDMYEGDYMPKEKKAAKFSPDRDKNGSITGIGEWRIRFKPEIAKVDDYIYHCK